MPRSKVTKGLITNEKSRRHKFSKRKKCLIKKISELSTLCDVRVGLILYEDEGSSNIAPEIYPQDPQAIKQLINMYREQPRADSKKWNTNLSTVLSSLKMKAEMDITKLQESTIVQRPTSPPMSTNLDDLSEGQLAEFGEYINKKIENVKKVYEVKQNQEKVRPPTIISHPYLPMQSMQYNMQLGALYSHQKQNIMPFVYPQNISIPTQYQVHETPSFNDGCYNQMESSSSAAAAASMQYDHRVHHHSIGQYAMWYPPVNTKPLVLPYMHYYHGGMKSNGDSAKWQMQYSSQGNYGPPPS